MVFSRASLPSWILVHPTGRRGDLKRCLSSSSSFPRFKLQVRVGHARAQDPTSRGFASFESAEAELGGGKGKGKEKEKAPPPPPPPLKNPFPYPSSSRLPTPHQLFHLPGSASQAEIKARYYELVKAHHPDSQYAAHLPADIAHARFQAIQAAYDFLRGKTLSPYPNSPFSSFYPSTSSSPFGASSPSMDPYAHEMARRRRAYYAYHGARDFRRGEEGDREGWAKPGWGEGFGAPAAQRTVWDPDGWRERLILAFGVITLLAGLFPSMPVKIASMFVGSSAYVAPSPSTSPSSSSSASTSRAKRVEREFYHSSDITTTSTSTATTPSSSTDAPSSNSTPSSTPTPTPTPNSTPSSNSISNPTSNPTSSPSSNYASNSASSSTPFTIPFLDLDKSHRAAVSALHQARAERQEVGDERREGVRRRVREMGLGLGSPSVSPPELPSETETGTGTEARQEQQ